jgi:hypothetical protein
MLVLHILTMVAAAAVAPACCFCVQAYSPLAKASKLNDPTVIAIAKRLNKTTAQVCDGCCFRCQCTSCQPACCCHPLVMYGLGTVGHFADVQQQFFCVARCTVLHSFAETLRGS